MRAPGQVERRASIHTPSMVVTVVTMSHPPVTFPSLCIQSMARHMLPVFPVRGSFST